MSETLEIRLGNSGYVALIDAEDAPKIEGWRFYYWKRPNRTSAYAIGQRGSGHGGANNAWLHRLVLGETDPKVHIDHKDGDGLDCRKKNLRRGTQTQNNRNRRPARDRTGFFKGVSWIKSRQRWRVTINDGSRLVYIGEYADEVDAAMAYDEASRKFHGEWGKTNEDLGLLPKWIEEGEEIMPA